MDQSRLTIHFVIGGFTDCEEKGSRRFQICDVVDVATGEVRRDGGHPVEVLKAQRPAGNEATVRRAQTCRNQGSQDAASGQVRTFAASTRVCS